MIGRARSWTTTPGRRPRLPLKRPGRWCRVGSSCHDDDRPVGTATHPDHSAGPTVATRFLEPVSHAVPGCVQRQRVQVPRHVSRSEPGVYHRRNCTQTSRSSRSNDCTSFVRHIPPNTRRSTGWTAVLRVSRRGAARRCAGSAALHVSRRIRGKPPRRRVGAREPCPGYRGEDWPPASSGARRFPATPGTETTVWRPRPYGTGFGL